MVSPPRSEFDMGRLIGVRDVNGITRADAVLADVPSLLWITPELSADVVMMSIVVLLAALV